MTANTKTDSFPDQMDALGVDPETTKVSQVEDDSDWVQIGGGDQAPVHDFEVDNTMVGVLVEKRTGVGPKKSNMYIFENSDGSERKAVWGSTVIDDKMTQVEIGDVIKIVYNGKEKSAQGNFFKSYTFYRRQPKKAN